MLDISVINHTEDYLNDNYIMENENPVVSYNYVVSLIIKEAKILKIESGLTLLQEYSTLIRELSECSYCSLGFLLITSLLPFIHIANFFTAFPLALACYRIYKIIKKNEEKRFLFKHMITYDQLCFDRRRKNVPSQYLMLDLKSFQNESTYAINEIKNCLELLATDDVFLFIAIRADLLRGLMI